MSKYIDADKLIAEIERRLKIVEPLKDTFESCAACRQELIWMKEYIDSLQQEQPDNMIHWTGSNLQEVINFTGKSPKFGEWFKSWDEFESYVHSHGDILKLFSEDGSHFEVPVGAWIVKTPDGHNVPSVARFIHANQEQPDFDDVDPKHLVHSHYTKVCETKTGRVFWAEYSSEAAEWYEAGTGKAYSISDVEIVREQPEVDLDREIIKYKVPFTDESEYLNETTLDAIARHFYELGLNARKEDIVI